MDSACATDSLEVDIQSLLAKLCVFRESIKSLSHEQLSELLKALLTSLETAIIEQEKDSQQLIQNMLTVLRNQYDNQKSVNGIDIIIYKTITEANNNYIKVLDTESNIIKCNNGLTKAVGYKKQSDLHGRSYVDYKCDAASRAERWLAEDQKVIKTQRAINYLSLCQLNDNEHHLLLGEKTPIFNNDKKVIGVYSSAVDITDFHLIDISRFLFAEDFNQSGKFSQKQFDYIISDQHDQFGLTEKELEVLFFLLRGKTSKEIAQHLCRSARTVESHLEMLKIKFNTKTKSDLIEKAIFSGYMTILPKTLLG